MNRLTRPATALAGLALTALALSGSATSQGVVTHESLTGWQHAHGGPFWTDDVPNPAADFGVVDRLNYVWWLAYESPVYTLQPGDYVASCRLMKALSQPLGAVPIHLEVTVDGYPTQVTLAVADQTIDQFVSTPNLNFTVTHPNSQVQFRLFNTAGELKVGYEFDSFRLGRHDLGGSIHYSSVSEFAYFANPDRFQQHVPDTSSALGQVTTLSNVNWLRFHEFAQLEPGAYWARLRLRKDQDTTGREDLTLKVEVNGRVVATSVIPAADQTVGQWVSFPARYFEVAGSSTAVKFTVENIQGTPKRNYSFDALQIAQSTTFRFVGSGCPGTSGMQPSLLTIVPSSMGANFSLRLVDGRAGSAGYMMLGFQPQQLDLTAIGMTGCTLHVAPALTTAGVIDAAGTMDWSFPIPPDRSLLRAPLYNQAIVLDLGANALNLITSDAFVSTIGN